MIDMMQAPSVGAHHWPHSAQSNEAHSGVGVRRQHGGFGSLCAFKSLIFTSL
jgi:hypothetical protein